MGNFFALVNLKMKIFFRNYKSITYFAALTPSKFNKKWPESSKFQKQLRRTVGKESLNGWKQKKDLLFEKKIVDFQGKEYKAL